MPPAITQPTDRPPANHPVALLCVSGDDGWNAQHQLEIDAMVIVGSSDRCGLSLSDDDVASMHCSLRRDETGIWLSDWGSHSGTFLDGARVTTETQVHSGNTIQFGTYTIELGFLDLGEIDEFADTISLTAASKPAVTKPTPQAGIVRPVETGHGKDPVGAFPSRGQPPRLERRPPSEAVNAADLAQSRCPHDDRENFEMLRAEVEQLQYELAERDAQLAQLMEPVDDSDTPTDEASSDLLLGRIEELLGELDRSDSRMVTLEELLVAAEEANCAEREERRQLESWIADIEALVSEHDKTRNAEVETLKQQIAALVTQREELMQNLFQPASADDADQTDTEEVARLRAQITHLGQQLHDANAATARSDDELRSRETQLAEATDAKRELREEHLKIAEERAALTRLRAEIMAQQSEKEIRPEDPRTDVDSRVRVFRQHLREIHEEEKKQHDEKRLSIRIARLWKRVEHP